MHTLLQYTCCLPPCPWRAAKPFVQVGHVLMTAMLRLATLQQDYDLLKLRLQNLDSIGMCSR